MYHRPRFYGPQVNEHPVDVEQVLTCPAASKEWVIQPKPKPGRKPKTDPIVKDDSEVRAFMSLDERAIRLKFILRSRKMQKVGVYRTGG